MILEKLKILRSHGRQWIRNLDEAAVAAPFRGCPVIAPGAPDGLVAHLAEMCPSRAIGAADGLSIDLGRCIFCGECALEAPAYIRFSTDHRMAASRREDLIVTAQNAGRVPFCREAVRPAIGDFFSRALKLREVSAAGDNACEMELNASMNVNFDFSRFGVEFVASPRHADGVVVTGPVSVPMAVPLQVCYDAVPEPKIVVCVGADAISGGLFEGSRALDRSFFDRHTPDLYIPGNPAHPLTFIDGVMKLTGRKIDR